MPANLDHLEKIATEWARQAKLNLSKFNLTTAERVYFAKIVNKELLDPGEDHDAHQS